MVGKLEEKTNQLVSAMKEMEHRLKQSETHRGAAEETARKLGQIIADKDQKSLVYNLTATNTLLSSQRSEVDVRLKRPQVIIKSNVLLPYCIVL
ncbi:hypothetical protein Btru_015953 [Bulinus truncatus]|nr:hypothetical protein Btru_015953 [Bulinus truncatus]